MRYFLLLLATSKLCSGVLLAQGTLPPEHKMQQMRREARDPAKRDKVEDFQLAAEYWSKAKNLKNIPDMDAALAEVLPVALKQSSEITEFQTWEKAHEYKSYHDAGAILLAKCYTLLYYGRVEAAKEGLQLIDTKLRFSMLLGRDRGFVWVRRQMHYHEHFCALYAAMLYKKFEQCPFPQERDEFDGEAQRKALEDMVRLRIQDGGFQMLEQLFKAARTANLKRQNGLSVLNEFYSGVTPIYYQEESEVAWKEMREGIEKWRKAAPVSIPARIAEASFWLEFAIHAFDKSDNPPRNAEDEAQRRLLRSQAILDETRRDCPGWYALKIRMMDWMQAPFPQVAEIFKEGTSKFPDYEPIHVAMCNYLTDSKELDGLASAGMITELAKRGQTRIASHCLREMAWRNRHRKTYALLPPATIDDLIFKSITEYPLSLDLRNDLAFVAYMAQGQSKTVAWCLRGMKGRWDRATWERHEDVAISNATDEDLEPTSKKPVATSL